MITKEKQNEYAKTYRQTHPEQVKAYRRKYYYEHREKLLGIVKEYSKRRLTEDPDYQKKYYEKNKEKFKKASRKWNSEHPEKMREASYKLHIKKNYGLTVEDYQNMIEAQGNRCKICGEEMTKTPCVDHDHETGKIRGLLCNSCNVGLGGFKDNIPSLLRAIAYLEENQDK